MNKLQQAAIFNLFHDGSLGVLQRNGNDIAFQIEIAYLAGMINPSHTSFQGLLKNCQQCVFTSWKDETSSYKDLDTISSLLKALEVSHVSVENDHIAIFFIGEPTVFGGSLKIICDAIQLWSEAGENVMLDELQRIAQHYWDDFSKQK